MNITHPVTRTLFICMGYSLPVLAQAENHALVNCSIFKGYENCILAGLEADLILVPGHN